jgi:hypothetical protein
MLCISGSLQKLSRAVNHCTLGCLTISVSMPVHRQTVVIIDGIGRECCSVGGDRKLLL